MIGKLLCLFGKHQKTKEPIKIIPYSERYYIKPKKLSTIEKLYFCERCKKILYIDVCYLEDRERREE